MKKISILVIGLLVVIASYLYASPYLALNNIKNAAQARDADKLSSYIDFPSVKQGVKEQVKAKFASEMITGENQNGFEALGSMLAASMIDTLVDGLITPDGMAAMMLEKSTEADTTQEESNEFKELDYETSYTSFNSFQVDINNKENRGVKITLYRDGLRWKINNIDLPLDNF